MRPSKKQFVVLVLLTSLAAYGLSRRRSGETAQENTV